MEPFALFNLLKTLLPQAEKTENFSPSANTVNPQNSTSSTQNPTPNSTQPTTETNAQILPPNNSFLEFSERHDERARRIKKK